MLLNDTERSALLEKRTQIFHAQMCIMPIFVVLNQQCDCYLFLCTLHVLI